jgi:hypothetical protein
MLKKTRTLENWFYYCIQIGGINAKMQRGVSIFPPTAYMNMTFYFMVYQTHSHSSTTFLEDKKMESPLLVVYRHDIVAILDGTSNPYLLNDYYQTTR